MGVTPKISCIENEQMQKKVNKGTWGRDPMKYLLNSTLPRNFCVPFFSLMGLNMNMKTRRNCLWLVMLFRQEEIGWK